jgi:APA family basic amino acid/polyamine antiporter
LMETSGMPGLVRSMRRWDLVGVVINGVIGAGIFGLPSRVFALAGPYSIFAFLICAVCVAAIVLCFAEVASRYSATGGPYLYASEAYGPATGFLVGWLVFVARLTSFAANCSLLPAYLGLFFPALAAGTGRACILTLVVVVLAAVNVAGVRVAANTSNLFAAGKLIPLAVFVVAGLFFLDPARFSMGVLPGYRPFSQSVMLLVYAFTGFEMSVIPAGEARKPGRDLPVALMAGMSVVVVFYVLIQVVAIGTLPELADSQRPLADAAARFLGPGGAVMITVGIVVSLAGNLNVLMLSASRIIFAMAEHGELPALLAAIHPRHRTPSLAVLTTAAIMLGLTLSGTFLWLLTLSTLARLVAYIATAGALPVLRRDTGAPEAKFRLCGGVAVAVAAIGLGLWLISNSTLREARDTAIAAGIGLTLYYAYRTWRRRAGADIQETIEP